MEEEMGKEEEEEEGREGGGLEEKGDGSELEYRKIWGHSAVLPACVSIFFRGTKKIRSCCTPAAAPGVQGSVTKEHELQEKDNAGKLEEGDEEEMELHHETNNAQKEAEKKK